MEGHAPAVHVPSKTPAPHGKGVPASPAADPGIQLTASRRSDLIVVGVDESPGSARAVDWAAAEAARRHGSLRLVNAVADLTPFGAEGAVYGVTNLDATKMVEHAAMPGQKVTRLSEAEAVTPYFSILLIHGQGRRP